MSLRSVFIHGRPGPHPFQTALAHAIRADFVPVDFLLRWHGVSSSPLRRYLSWLLCAAFFPRVDAYQIFLANSVYFLPPIMRRLGRLRKDQRLAVHLCDETLFCLKANRYPRLTARSLLWALNNYDALFCLGRMEAELARSLLGTHGAPLVLETRGGLLRDRQDVLSGVRPTLDCQTILFVGEGPGEWRGWYKGLDLLIEAVGIASAEVAGLRLCVIGRWDPGYIKGIMSRLSTPIPTIEFAGSLWELSAYVRRISEAALYVHLGRGDTFPISVLEAMCAGIPSIVSESTGTSEAVEQVDAGLVVPCDAVSAAEKIRWYFNLRLEERRALSARSREVAAQYTEERAVESFVESYRQILRHFGLPELPQEVIGRNLQVDRSQWWPRQA